VVDQPLAHPGRRRDGIGAWPRHGASSGRRCTGVTEAGHGGREPCLA
jgi:hypothetical protein